MIFSSMETLDLSTAKYERNIGGIVKDFCERNKNNTPFVIRTGDDTQVRAHVTMVLDRITYATKWYDDEIEVLEVC